MEEVQIRLSVGGARSILTQVRLAEKISCFLPNSRRIPGLFLTRHTGLPLHIVHI